MSSRSACFQEVDSDDVSADSEESESSDLDVPRTCSAVSSAPFVAMEVPYRFRSPVLLLCGGIFGLMGFSVAFVIGLLHFFMRKTDHNGVPYKSGNGYWPATVSEMVYSWNSPEGRIFFGFCLISALLIFQSWYPFMLRNVYTGSEALCNRCSPIYWITFRQVVPVVGLLLLICVSTVPASMATFSDDFAVVVHLMGAGMMFMGYIVSEMKCLELCSSICSCLEGKKQAKFLDIEGPERKLRKACMLTVVLFYMIFVVCQVALEVYQDTLCCSDEFEEGRKSLETYSLWYATINTASGYYLAIKIISFTSEVVSGMALIFSHIIIWYYCEERHCHYAENAIMEVYDEENSVDVHNQATTIYVANAHGC